MNTKDSGWGPLPWMCCLKICPEAWFQRELQRGLLPEGSQQTDGTGVALEPKAAYTPIGGDGEPGMGDDILKLQSQAVQHMVLVGRELEKRADAGPWRRTVCNSPSAVSPPWP